MYSSVHLVARTYEYTKKGCRVKVQSKIYMIKSIVPGEHMDDQLHSTAGKDSSTSWSGGNDSETTIIYVASEDIIRNNDYLLDKRQKFIQNLRHGDWIKVTPSMSEELEKRFSLDNGYSLNSIRLQQVHCYSALIHSTVDNSNTYTIVCFDEVLYALAHSTVRGLNLTNEHLNC